jgi:DNA-binding Lrp family transcriptional regulator
MLKPQDVLVLLKLLAKGNEPWAQGKLAMELGMSASEVNAGLKRLEHSGLVLRKGVKAAKGKEQISIVVAKEAAREFLLYAIKYLFPAKRGEPTRGMLAAYSAGGFPKKLTQPGDLPPVWPDPTGEARGFAFKPLYSSVPFAAKQDKKLYDLLAIADVLRSGNARDIKVAKDLLSKELDG